MVLANALKQHHVGLEEREHGVWSLYLGPVLIGTIGERTIRCTATRPHPPPSVTHHAGIQCYPSSRLLTQRGRLSGTPSNSCRSCRIERTMTNFSIDAIDQTVWRLDQLAYVGLRQLEHHAA